MCGRFFLARRAIEIAQALGLGLSQGADRWTPRYNIAPTQDVLTVVAGPMGMRIEPRRWGLIPHWAKDLSIGNQMINARLEGIDTKPAYGKLFRTSRCVVLADGFFEWRKDPQGKTPVMIRPEPDGLMGFAGLWTRWKPPTGDEVMSCTIITRAAVEPVVRVHDRMPAILPRESWGQWTQPETVDPKELVKLLEDAVTPSLATVEISKLVNSPRNDTPEILNPV